MPSSSSSSSSFSSLLIDFHVPAFCGSVRGALSQIHGIRMFGLHELKPTSEFGGAVADQGFPVDQDGVHVFSMVFVDGVKRKTTRKSPVPQDRKIDYFVGFTNAYYKGETVPIPGEGNAAGISLCGKDGKFLHWNNSVSFDRISYLSQEDTCVAREVVTILSVAKGGKEITIQWIVDGNEGRKIVMTPESFCIRSRENEKPIRDDKRMYPVVILHESVDRVRMVPFDQLKSTSRTIECLKEKFVIDAARRQIDRLHELRNAAQSKTISDLKNELRLCEERSCEREKQHVLERTALGVELTRSYEQQRQQQVQQHECTMKMKNDLLERERIEHAKTRLLLEHFTKELSEKEASLANTIGQRRQRE